VVSKVLELVGLFFLPYVQEDTAAITAALLALNRVFPAWQTLGVCALGMWTSDFLVYLLGRLGGLNLFRFHWVRMVVSRSQVERAAGWFNRFGWPALVFTRLVPGSRTALLFTSGLLHYPIRKFLFVSICAAVLWLAAVFALFFHFGISAAAMLGSRWIISLVLFALGGTAGIALLARRWSRQRATETASVGPEH
jgi:membrane-associated protein